MSSSDRVTITWKGGGTAVIDAIDGDRVEVVSTRAFAPGSRPEGTLVTSGHAIWLKVHGARRQEDGAFRIKGRLLNVRREVLHLLKEIVPGPNSGKSPAS
jgi:hypothetical protein